MRLLETYMQYKEGKFVRMGHFLNSEDESIHKEIE